MLGYKVKDWADNVEDVCNSKNFPLFKVARLHWSTPTVWHRTERLPTFDTDQPFLYALIDNHHRARQKDKIVYVGLTTNPKTRFGNHEKAIAIRDHKSETTFSYATIDFIKGRNRLERIESALEEIEHLLIWAIGDHLINERKQFTLPGMGTNGANAWQILNEGHRFSGRMPREIVYPWMIVKPGRDRSIKKTD